MNEIRNNEYEIVPRLQEFMDKAGITQDMLSSISGVSQVVISRFDTQKGYSMKTLVRLAKTFGCSIEDLFVIKEVDKRRKQNRNNPSQE